MNLCAQVRLPVRASWLPASFHAQISIQYGSVTRRSKQATSWVLLATRDGKFE